MFDARQATSSGEFVLELEGEKQAEQKVQHRLYTHLIRFFFWCRSLLFSLFLHARDGSVLAAQAKRQIHMETLICNVTLRSCRPCEAP